MINNKPRFVKGDVNYHININDGIFLAGCSAADNSDGSIYLAIKKIGEPFISRRLDNGSTFAINSNEGGTWTPDTNTTGGKDSYVWAVQLA